MLRNTDRNDTQFENDKEVDELKKLCLDKILKIKVTEVDMTYGKIEKSEIIKENLALDNEYALLLLAAMNAALQPFAAHAADERTQKIAGEKRVAAKTPASFLQEICAKRTIIPKYELLKTEGQVHDPTFVFGVTVDDLSASGIGCSKRIAKHQAAKNLLERLVTSGRHQTFKIPGETNDEALEFINALAPESFFELPAKRKGKIPAENGTENSTSENPDNVPVNSVGLLQQTCVKKNWPPAIFEIVDETGLPHDRTFTCKVQLGSFTKLATGRSKKMAKRDAASNMLEIISEIELHANDSKKVLMRDNDDALQSKFNAIMSDMGQKVKSVLPADFNGVKAFFTHLKSQPVDTLLKEHVENFENASKEIKKSINFVYVLQKIAEIGTFEVNYVDLKGRNIAGEYQCLAQLAVPPVVVVVGNGPTVEDAKQVAAYNALEYLKLFTFQ